MFQRAECPREGGAIACGGWPVEQADRRQIMGISEVMVKVHRANGMRKMQAKSVAELVRMIDAANQPLRVATCGRSYYPEAGGYFGRRIATNQSHEIPVCEFKLEACSIGMVVQETMKTKLDDQALQTLALSIRNLGFDFRKRVPCYRLVS